MEQRRLFSDDSDNTSSVVVSHGLEGVQAGRFSAVQTLDMNRLFEQAEQRHERTPDEEEDGEAGDGDGSALDSFLNSMAPSPPSSPPRELDPGRLYALLNFQGPDPGHIQLSKNDPVELLNDEDSYWWLVRKLDREEEEIGFAPAEILETYEERLARLNCWKNEILERGSADFSDLPVVETVATPVAPITPTNSIKRKSSIRKSGRGLANWTPKSVSFAVEQQSEDERSEVFSEAYSDCTPLQISKRAKRRLDFENLDNCAEDDDEDYVPSEGDTTLTDRRGSLDSEASDLAHRLESTSIFMAPNAKFKIATQDSIGTYSPDSSDPETTPPLNTFNQREEKALRIKEDRLRDVQKRAQIPLSGRQLDIAAISKEEEEDDSSLSEKECSFATMSASSSSLTNTTPATSLSFVTSTESKAEELSGESESTISCASELHPTTAKIFNPVFSQLDKLEDMLRELME